MRTVIKHAATMRSACVRASTAAAPARVFHVRAAAAAAVPTADAAQLFPLLTTPLSKIDPEIYEIIEQEKKRQWESLALIPSEVGQQFNFILSAPTVTV